MGDGILRSAGGTGASGNSRRHLRCMKEAGISYTMKPYIRSGYEVPHDAHAEPPLILLQLNHLGDRREQHMVKLVKSSVFGSAHPSMTLLFHQHHMMPSQSLILEQLLVNDIRPWSEPLHLTNGLLSRNPDSYSTQIQRTENGPVIETFA